MSSQGLLDSKPHECLWRSFLSPCRDRIWGYYCWCSLLLDHSRCGLALGTPSWTLRSSGLAFKTSCHLGHPPIFTHLPACLGVYQPPPVLSICLLANLNAGSTKKKIIMLLCPSSVQGPFRPVFCLRSCLPTGFHWLASNKSVSSYIPAQPPGFLWTEEEFS